MTDTATPTATEEVPEEPGKALERIVGELQKRLTDISYSDLISAIAPKPLALPAPAQAPLPAEITPKQKAALEKLPKVFGKVVPTERRALEPIEVGKLLDEREVLDEIATMAEKRKGGIRTTICNHLDVTAENDGKVEHDEDGNIKNVLFDKDGHYLLGGEARAPKHEKMFRRELRSNSPTLSEGILKELADDPDIDFISHRDFLDMTSQVRVLDENKVMLALRKNPKLLMAIARATTSATTPQTGSLNIRKA